MLFRSPGFEPDPHARAQPIQLRSGEPRPGGQGRGRPAQSGKPAGKPAATKPASAAPGKSAGPRDVHGQPRPARAKARPGGETSGARPAGTHRQGGRGR